MFLQLLETSESQNQPTITTKPKAFRQHNQPNKSTHSPTGKKKKDQLALHQTNYSKTHPACKANQGSRSKHHSTIPSNQEANTYLDTSKITSYQIQQERKQNQITADTRLKLEKIHGTIYTNGWHDPEPQAN